MSGIVCLLLENIKNIIAFKNLFFFLKPTIFASLKKFVFEKG